MIIVYSMVLIVFAGCKPEFIIDNPYEKVIWENFGQYKSDFHSHTSHSDGNYSPHVIVDLYHNKGYDILAIADHNRVTYPWQKFSSLEPSIIMTRRQNVIVSAGKIIIKAMKMLIGTLPGINQ